MVSHDALLCLLLTWYMLQAITILVDRHQLHEHAENVMLSYLAFLLSLPRTSLIFFF